MSEIKVKLNEDSQGVGIAHYHSGFTDYEAEILCITIDAFGSGEHPCATPGANEGYVCPAVVDYGNGPEPGRVVGVGLRGFAVVYIIEVCENALKIWSEIESGPPDSINEHMYASDDNNLNPVSVLEDAISRLQVTLSYGGSGL